MGDVRGILNMMDMPCRLCRHRGNYDGWRVNDETIIELDCPDAWAAMRKIAAQEGLEWAISGDNVWFTPEPAAHQRKERHNET